MKLSPHSLLVATLSFSLLAACGDDDSNSDGGIDPGTVTLSSAFDEFSEDAFTIMLDGDEVVITTTGLPNHESPYWSNTTERTIGNNTTAAAAVDHPLFVAPTATSFNRMSPGNIDDFTGEFTLRVPASPEKASSTSRTGLGPIGLAVSGSVIYNDEEGPNVPLENAVGSLDYTGAHTGPQSYHYHLEPVAFSDDDDALVGIISDGFFVYGRKCNATGDYPDDLDASGGHTASTQHSEQQVYHYHIQNETYLNEFYIIFPGDYQGTPNAFQ